MPCERVVVSAVDSLPIVIARFEPLCVLQRIRRKDGTEVEAQEWGATPPPQVVYHSDVCSICQEEVSMLDTTTFRIYTCCGKVMHRKCWNDLWGSKLSHETKNTEFFFF